MKNKQGFLLADSLISIIVVSAMAFLCLFIYESINNYQEGYLMYRENISEELTMLYGSLQECQKCQIEQEDSSSLEP